MSPLSAKKGFVENKAYGEISVRIKSKRKYITLLVAGVILIGILGVAVYGGVFNHYGKENNYRATADHVVINEVYYDAPSGYGEPQCEWIELYNPTDNEVDIAGWMISDDPAHDGSNEGVWTFPAGTTIPARGYLLIVNDATYKGQFSSLFPGVTPDFDTNQSNSIPDVSTAGSLSLRNNGDDVHLYDSEGTEIDVMWYGSGGDVGSGNAAPDVSAGHSLARYYNAEDTDNPSADFYNENNPTPGAQNNLEIPEFTMMFPVIAIAIVGILVYRRKH